MPKTASFSSLCKKFIDQNKQTYIDNLNQQPSYDTDDVHKNKIQTQTQKITITLNELLEENKRVLEKDIKAIKKHLNENPKLELRKPVFNAQEFDCNIFQTELNTPIIIRRLDDPTPIYTIQNNYIFKVNSIEKLKTYWLNKFIFFSFKTIKNEIILKLEKKLIELENKKTTKFPMSRQSINAETATLETATKSLEGHLRKIRKAIKEETKKKGTKGKLDYLINLESTTKELINDVNKNPIEKDNIYERQLKYIITSELYKNNWKPIRFTLTSIATLMGYTKNTLKGSTRKSLKEALVSISTKSYKGIMLYRSNDVWLKEPGDPLFQIKHGSKYNLSLSKSSEIKDNYFVVSLHNEGYKKELQNFYVLIDDNILIRMRSYFNKIDIFTLDFIFRVINKTSEQKGGKHMLDIIDFMNRTGNTDVLNETKTGFTSRKNKKTNKEKIINILNFLKQNNYISSYNIDDTKIHINCNNQLFINNKKI